MRSAKKFKIKKLSQITLKTKFGSIFGADDAENSFLKLKIRAKPVRGFLRGAAEPATLLRVLNFLNFELTTAFGKLQEISFFGKIEKRNWEKNLIENLVRIRYFYHQRWPRRKKFPFNRKVQCSFLTRKCRKILKKDDNLAQSAKFFWKNTIFTYEHFEVFFNKMDVLVERKIPSKFSKKVENFFDPIGGGEFWPMGAGNLPQFLKARSGFFFRGAPCAICARV